MVCCSCCILFVASDNTMGNTKYAFVEFTSVAAAEKAISLNGALCGDRPMKIGKANNPIIKSPAIIQQMKAAGVPLTAETLGTTGPANIINGSGATPASNSNSAPPAVEVADSETQRRIQEAMAKVQAAAQKVTAKVNVLELGIAVTPEVLAAFNSAAPPTTTTTIDNAAATTTNGESTTEAKEGEKDKHKDKSSRRRSRSREDRSSRRHRSTSRSASGSRSPSRSHKSSSSSSRRHRDRSPSRDRHRRRRDSRSPRRRRSPSFDRYRDDYYVSQTVSYKCLRCVRSNIQTDVCFCWALCMFCLAFRTRS